MNRKVGRKTILAAVTLALALALPDHGRAQSSRWEFALSGGALRHDFLFEDDEIDPVVGVRLARYSAGGWGFGVAGDWVPAGDVTHPEQEDVDFKAHLVRYSAGLDKSFGVRSRVQLNIGGGVGAMTALYRDLPTEDGTENESETHLLVPVSIGVKFLNRAIRPSWGVHVQGRDNIVFLDDTDILGSPRSEEVQHMPDVRAGLSFFFGGGRMERVVEPPPAREPAPRAPERDLRDDDEARRRALAGIQERIHFDFDKFDLRPDAREVLRRKAETLRAFPEVRILIEGHADERGTIEYNLALGERRANSARAFLIELGIDPDRLTTVSYGEERPLIDRQDEAAWSQNRRAEFVPINW